ncbi:hypothetical protein EJ07DRAFT_177113 [Lizonia empirigonia]|nr:hypothetical protein EJ07DRAFT_177113 [Lizonia empirigonia]
METPTSSTKKRSAPAPLTDEATRTVKRQKAASETKDAISLRNQQQSPLLRLPPEIRNMIWEKRDFKLVKWQNRGRFSPIEMANFSLVCRQIHAETALLPFRMGSVTFGIGFIMGPESARQNVNWFLSRLTATQLGVIRDVSVAVHPLSPWFQPPGSGPIGLPSSDHAVHGEEYRLFKHFVGLEQLEVWDHSHDERELSVPDLKPLLGLSKSVELIVKHAWARVEINYLW